MKTCPFCGAEPATGSYNIGAVRAWVCDTNYAIRTDYGEPFGSITPVKKEYLFRGEACYEHQLAQQAELLGRALEVMINVEATDLVSDVDLEGKNFFWCVLCGAWHRDKEFLKHSKTCSLTKILDLIPDLEKALEKA